MPGVVAIIAVLDDEPAGFAMTTFGLRGQGARREHADCSLDAIAVEPTQRAMGVGKALLAGVLRRARERGATAVRLVTAEANVAALDLFLRSGFEIIERIAHYYPRGQNAVVMRATLVP
jgi:ribosomal protein S18 acetylase RimI-like enzyme